MTDRTAADGMQIATEYLTGVQDRAKALIHDPLARSILYDSVELLLGKLKGSEAEKVAVNKLAATGTDPRHAVRGVLSCASTIDMLNDDAEAQREAVAKLEAAGWISGVIVGRGKSRQVWYRYKLGDEVY